MALLDDLTKGATPANLAIGVGAALLAPVLAPAVSSIFRPAAKAAMRTGISLYRGAMEPISAAVGSLVTEAQLELATASTGPARASTPEPPKEPRPPVPRKDRDAHP